MKIANINMKTVFASLAIAVMVVAAATPALANNEKRAGKKNIPVEVKYVGSNNQSPVVELDGYLLYTVTSSDKKITRKFQIDNHSLEPIQLKVAVTINGKVQTDLFQINRNRVVVEDVVVSKL